MDGTDFSLLDVPRDAPVGDADAYLRTAIAWHFGADTGSPFWLRAANDLDFDPLTDVRSLADLRLFPNLVDDLRWVPVADLIPRGYGSPAPVPWIFESGGTTGAPKRTVQMPDWVEQVTRWQMEDFADGGFVPNSGLLFIMPSGPHGVGHFSRAVAQRSGSMFYPVDLDPRWAKKLAAGGAGAQLSGYVGHVLEQAEHILRTQNVANLHTTPPLLEAIARDDALADLVSRRIRYVLLSGAHLDADTLDLLRQIFPYTTISMAFVSTMILSKARTRIETACDTCVFD
ncbi:MAG: phenazine antibiotic biosynthesis protein, partial [Mycobacteriaceae bacterium]|nr:phenazine antibiotic biosynthesis protein [Mycobacteriaceae bacterium]